MTSETTEIVLMWLAVTAYAAGSVLYAAGAVFGSRRVAHAATIVSLAGLVPHALGIAVRWARIGHGPYLGFYEVVSAFAFFSVAGFAAIVWRRRDLAAVGVGLMPLSFLLLGAAMLAPKPELEITATLASWWLTIHVAFAKLAYSALTASFALAVLYLIRDQVTRPGWRAVFERLPEQDAVEDLSYRFVALGFIFLGIMIAAGAIWANQAWGRYWSWDPIETWSLVTWLVYAAYLHVRLTLGWHGRKLAWFAVAALPVLLFALIGVPIVYDSIHGAYLNFTGR